VTWRIWAGEEFRRMRPQNEANRPVAIVLRFTLVGRRSRRSTRITGGLTVYRVLAVECVYWRSLSNARGSSAFANK
jgi:hypothetical protein